MCRFNGGGFLFSFSFFKFRRSNHLYRKKCKKEERTIGQSERDSVIHIIISSIHRHCDSRASASSFQAATMNPHLYKFLKNFALAKHERIKERERETESESEKKKEWKAYSQSWKLWLNFFFQSFFFSQYFPFCYFDSQFFFLFLSFKRKCSVRFVRFSFKFPAILFYLLKEPVYFLGSFLHLFQVTQHFKYEMCEIVMWVER